MKLPDDPIIIELLPEFVDDWTDNIKSNYPKYLKEKNSQELYRLAHTLKGSCFQFSIDDIAEMGLQTMQYVKNEDWDKIAEMEGKLLTAFDEVNEFLKKEGLK